MCRREDGKVCNEQQARLTCLVKKACKQLHGLGDLGKNRSHDGDQARGILHVQPMARVLQNVVGDVARFVGHDGFQLRQDIRRPAIAQGSTNQRNVRALRRLLQQRPVAEFPVREEHVVRSLGIKHPLHVLA